MIQKNIRLWAVLIVALIAINLWRWWPSFFSRGLSSRAGAAQGLELNYPQPLSADEETVHRDLFQMGYLGGSVRSHKPKVSRVVAVVPTPSAAPDGSVASTAEGYHLTGIVSRAGKNQALIEKNGQMLEVAPGDSLEGHYRVDSISSSEVYLTDQGTGTTLKLHIWDSSAKQ